MSDKSLKFLLFGEDKGASSVFGALGSHATGVTSLIGEGFGKLGNLIGGEMGEVVGKVGEAFDAMGEKQMGFSQKLMAAGGIVAGVGTALQMIGSADKQASDQLKQAITDSGHSFDDFQAKIEEAIATQQNFDHSAVDTQTALQNMTQALGSPQKALDNLGLASNLAAARHISLADAATLVDKILAGKGTKTLAEYGIQMLKTVDYATMLASEHHKVAAATHAVGMANEELKIVQESLGGKTKLTAAETAKLEHAQLKVKDTTYKLKTATDALNATQAAAAKQTDNAATAATQLAAKVDGQAAASVDNFGSKLDIVKTKFNDFIALMGGQFGAAIQGVGAGLGMLGSVLSIIKARKEAATAAALALAAATATETTVTEGATVAQGGLNLALLANPIGLVVLAIAALVGGFILAYNKIGWFRDGVNTAMAGVKVAIGWVVDKASEVFGWLRDHWQLVLGILTGPFGLAVLAIKGHWDTIKSGAQTLVSGIAAVFSGIVNVITWPFKTAFNAVSDMWNRTLGNLSFHVPDWVPVMGGKGFSFPSMPHLASGGTATLGGMVRVGENGPENMYLPTAASVVPLSRSQGGNTIVVQAPGQGFIGDERRYIEALITGLERVVGAGATIKIARGVVT